MIFLKQSDTLYNNDLRAMIMAFYPGIKITEKYEQQEYKIGFVAEFEASKTVIGIIPGDKINDESDISCCVYTDTIDGDYRDKNIFRNKLKLSSYRLLCKYTKRTLPWGDLTGVRPTKIAMAKIIQGCSHDETVENYRKVYDVSERKALLATKVAGKELSVISDIDKEKDYCLYIGIPFCPSRCLYCSFTSYPIATYKEKAILYIEKLKEELAYIADVYKNNNLVSIYVGGGTPTSISHELLDEMLTQVDKVFDLTKLREYTVEAGRPDSITREKLQVLKNHNITRISINPQTMNDETLKTIGRAHTAAQTKEAFYMAREMGFDNINMDLIAGLPGENADSMEYTLSQIEAMRPESITVHSLAIKRAANLKQQLSEYEDTINHATDQMLNMVSDTAEKLGMEPYYLYRQKNIGGNLENVGYAVKGQECLYNILIMEEITDIIAAGAGASTKLTFHEENRVERVENCKSVDDYIDRFDEMIGRKEKQFIGKKSLEEI